MTLKLPLEPILMGLLQDLLPGIVKDRYWIKHRRWEMVWIIHLKDQRIQEEQAGHGIPV